MVVALGALKLNTEEQPADGIVDLVGGLIGQEEGDGSVLVLRAGRGNQLVDHLVPRLVAVEALLQPLAHGIGLEPAVVGGARQQHRLPDVGHVPAIGGAGKQFVDGRGPLGWVLAIEEGGHLVGRRDDAGDVEVESAEEGRIIGRHRGRRLLGSDLALDLLVDDPGQGWCIEPAGLAGCQHHAPGQQQGCCQGCPPEDPGAKSHGRVSFSAKTQECPLHRRKPGFAASYFCHIL
jgi:hypothetical protein